MNMKKEIKKMRVYIDKDGFYLWKQNKMWK